MNKPEARQGDTYSPGRPAYRETRWGRNQMRSVVLRLHRYYGRGYYRPKPGGPWKRLTQLAIAEAITSEYEEGGLEPPIPPLDHPDVLADRRVKARNALRSRFGREPQRAEVAAEVAAPYGRGTRTARVESARKQIKRLVAEANAWQDYRYDRPGVDGPPQLPPVRDQRLSPPNARRYLGGGIRRVG